MSYIFVGYGLGLKTQVVENDLTGGVETPHSYLYGLNWLSPNLIVLHQLMYA